MKKVVTMGEIMLRLSTLQNERLIQANSFNAVFGGGEANVAVSLANYGIDSYFVSKIPDNPIGQSAINDLRRHGVKTDYIIRGGERIGIYFLEAGASMRSSKVVYDRANSSISEADVNDFDFDRIFENADWFHITGITPALSDKAAILAKEALIAAKKHGVNVSVDFNYRKKLWTLEKAREVMTTLMSYVDVCIGAEEVFGFHQDYPKIIYSDKDLENYKSFFKQMKDRFGFKYIATTLRESYSASDNGLSALAYDGKEFYHSKKYIIRVIDRVGGGDAFAGGFIYGLLDSERDFKHALEFAVAASALKHTIHGDFNLVDVEEVETLIHGDGLGRLER